MAQWQAETRHLPVLGTLTIIAACYGACVANIKGRLTAAEDLGQGNSGRLVVLVVVDQMRPDYLQRFENLWHNAGTTGFSWLEQKGVKFLDARTAAAPTVTAAGHASVCTGTVPAVHGISTNDYFDVKEKRTKALVDDPAARFVRTPQLLGAGPLETAPETGVSPDRLRAKTIGERLKETERNSRTVAVAIKDRSALLCGGRHNDGAYFFDVRSGSMVTSSALGVDALPDWVNDFNRSNRPETRGDWTLALGESARYSSVLIPQAQAASDAFVRRHYQVMGEPGRFPHLLKPTPNASPLELYPRFTRTPAANDYIVDFALDAVAKNKLGQRGSTDVLVVSFSTPDLVGHGFGIDSLELADTYVHLDRSLERLRNGIVTQLGSEQQASERLYWVLTADHGIQRMPEALQALGKPGTRIDEALFLQGLTQDILRSKGYSAVNFISGISTDQIVIDRNAILASSRSPAVVIEDLRDAALRTTAIAYAYTRDEVKAALQSLRKQAFARSPTPLTTRDRFLDALARGFDEAVSGDVFLVPREGSQFGGKSVSANHGTPWDDDARIPLIIVAPGIPAGTRREPVFADDIVPTLLQLIGHAQQPQSAAGDLQPMTGRSLLTKAPGAP